MLRTWLVALIALPALVACSSPIVDDTTDVDALVEAPPNFHLVSPGVYRGGHPSKGNIAYLDGLGVDTIVDLEVADLVEAWPWQIEKEQHDAAAAGIALERFPMSAFEPAKSDEFDGKIDGILALLRDKSRRPIYVHCKHGQDRTGLVIGLERVVNEGWSAKAAHDEMVTLGFHTYFEGLEDYFERKTGFNPEKH